MKIPFRAIGIASALVLLNAGLVGCQNDNMSNESHGEQFYPEDAQRDSTRLEMTQADCGALADGTLYPIDFSGDKLNSLGEAKLDRMILADPPLPLKVWMAIPDDGQAETRRVSVGTFLSDRGLTVEQITFGVGPNPESYSSADAQLAGFVKLETTDESQANSGNTATGSSSGSSGSSSGGSSSSSSGSSGH
ncbi:MAG TPA: hypothetical protein VMD30_02960 [Tepidisphaeraceae bacterium]|nr:hypothetical protein [Tepidisphaeraceae bacterium]